MLELIINFRRIKFSLNANINILGYKDNVKQFCKKIYVLILKNFLQLLILIKCDNYRIF